MTRRAAAVLKRQFWNGQLNQRLKSASKFSIALHWLFTVMSPVLVDQLLRGWKIHPEIRKRDESTGDFAVVQKQEPIVAASADGLAAFSQDWGNPQDTHLKVYPYAVSKGLLERVVKTLQLPIEVVKSIDEADAILALKSYARAGAKIYSLAEAQQVPVYVVKSNNLPQIQKVLREALHLDESAIGAVDIEEDVDETEIALEEARQAITRVVDRLEPIELAPRRSYIRRLQHQLVERFDLSSRSVGDGTDETLAHFAAGRLAKPKDRLYLSRSENKIQTQEGEPQGSLELSWRK